jgi:GMP synthase-like glutamine amidotransferase
MQALVIQPDEEELPGLVGAALVARGFSLDTYVIQPDLHRPEGSADFPALGSHDLIVIMGSPWSVYDEPIASWVEPLLGHLREAVSRDVPLLGICFGAQAMSAALGGVVTKGAASEFGWYSIDSSEPALCGPWFEFHQDVFTVPDGATELGRTEVGPQAFSVGRSLAVQFHPEIDSDQLLRWYESGEEGRLQHAGFDTVAALEQTRSLESEARRRVGLLVDWFLTRVANLDPSGERISHQSPSEYRRL